MDMKAERMSTVLENYYRYYSSEEKMLARRFHVQTIGYIYPGSGPTFSQNLNVRATSSGEAYAIARLIHDKRLNDLYTISTIVDPANQIIDIRESEPRPHSQNPTSRQTVRAFTVVVIREAGADPLTGVWLDQAEDHLSIHAPDRQQAYRIGSLVSDLPFRGQIRRLIIDGTEYFDNT